jgi:hypothetical protein
MKFPKQTFLGKALEIRTTLDDKLTDMIGDKKERNKLWTCD